MNNAVQVFVWTHIFIYPGQIQAVGSEGRYMFTFTRNCHTAPFTVIAAYYVPTNDVLFGNCGWFHILPNIRCGQSFHF